MHWSTADGFGQYTKANGEVYRGYWSKNCFVFDESLCDMSLKFDYGELRRGRAKVKYKCGIT